MTLIELARIASMFETDMAHEMLRAVAVAMYDPDCAFPVGDERSGPSARPGAIRSRCGAFPASLRRFTAAGGWKGAVHGAEE